MTTGGCDVGGSALDRRARLALVEQVCDVVAARLDMSYEAAMTSINVLEADVPRGAVLVTVGPWWQSAARYTDRALRIRIGTSELTPAAVELLCLTCYGVIVEDVGDRRELDHALTENYHECPTPEPTEEPEPSGVERREGGIFLPEGCALYRLVTAIEDVVAEVVAAGRA